MPKPRKQAAGPDPLPVPQIGDKVIPRGSNKPTGGTRRQMWSLLKSYLLLAISGVALFGLGFINLASTTDPSPIFGWPAAILGVLFLGIVFVGLDNDMKQKYPIQRGLVELTVGIVICIINLSSVHTISAVTFYSVMTAGVAACGKGLKDLL
jgi:hypothetical protein